MTKKTESIIKGIMMAGTFVFLAACESKQLDNMKPGPGSIAEALDLQEQSEAESCAAVIKAEIEIETKIPATTGHNYDPTTEAIESTLETTIALTEATEAPETICTTEAQTEIVTEPVTSTEAPTEAQITYSHDEILLLKAASCEAGDQGKYGMALVMRVILNRAALYNASIESVIYAPEQFACIYMQEWSDGYIAPGALEALDLVYSGWDESQGALYFCTPAHNSWHSKALTYLFAYNGHEYYR